MLRRVQEQRRKLLVEGPIGKALVTLSIPIILGNLLQTAYQITDAFWVGRLGADAIAAVSVSFPVTFVVIALGAGLAIAGATLSAQYMGAGKRDMVNHVAAQTMLMVALAALALGTLGYFVSPYLLRLMSVEPDVYEGALSYLHVSFVGAFFVFLYSVFQSLMRGIGETRIPLIIVLCTVLMNVVLDPLFIFGWGPIEGHGVTGAAMATLTTQAVAAFIGVVIFLRGRHGIHLMPNSLKPDVAFIRRAFVLGFPGSMELSMRGMGPMVMTFLAAGFGTVTLAAYGVGTNVAQVILIPAMGLSMAISTLVGQNIGAGNPERAQRATVLGSAAGFSVLTIAAVAAFPLAEPLARVFIPGEPDVIADAAHFIRISCWAWGTIGVQFGVAAAFRASGNTFFAMLIAFMCQWVFRLPVAYVLSRHTGMGPEGIWWSFPISNLLVAIVAAAWFATGSWKKKRLTPEDEETVAVTDEAIAEDGLR